jgi:hypothetical protein
MKTKSITFLILTISIFGLSSCSSIFTKLYGIKEVKEINEESIVRFSKDFNIPLSNSYTIDTSYFSYLRSLDSTLYKEQIKNHYQPLQALYFNKTGQFQSFQINCYAGGFPNLNWERNDIMTTFPPKQQAPLDSIISLETHLKYLIPLSQTDKISNSSFNYLVIVYWNRFMGRQSKRLIRIVQENSKLYNKENLKIIYVNTDNLFAKQLRK